jgi:O-antigen/teichoic acid export membrane protein
VILERKTARIIKNFSYAISSNLISLVISTLIVLVVPKILGLEEYGYWQLYLFYSSYVGFLHFGWSDGIYLRYGGEDYSNLDKKVFTSQFYLMFVFQSFIALMIVILSIFLLNNSDRMFIFAMVALNTIVVNVLSILLLTLQATNRIKAYAQINIISRVSYVSFIILLLLMGSRDYKLMIIADIVGKSLSLITAVYLCREIIGFRLITLKEGVKESLENIGVGINLMFANIASMLIIGVVRLGIEYGWDVTTFGKVSLTLSVSNMLMIFINATGIVIFPLLKKIHEKSLSNIYMVTRDILMIILFSILLLYFPMIYVLSKWLPNFADNLIFMALLFPISIYEGKMGLLINTYLKALRKERYILKVNLLVLSLSFVLTIVTTIILKNLNLAILTIFITISFRSILAEIYLSKIIDIKVIKDLGYELILSLLFILIGWYLEFAVGFVVYLAALIIYTFIKRKEIQTSLNILTKYLKT